MAASAEHGSGRSFAMRLLSFSGALCQELDLELLGLRVQQMCSTPAMGYAVQVLPSWPSSSCLGPSCDGGAASASPRGSTVASPAALGGRLYHNKNVRCELSPAETRQVTALADDLRQIVCAVRGGERRHSNGLADVFRSEQFPFLVRLVLCQCASSSSPLSQPPLSLASLPLSRHIRRLFCFAPTSFCAVFFFHSAAVLSRISRLSSSPLVLVTDTCTLWEGDGGCFLSAPRTSGSTRMGSPELL